MSGHEYDFGVRCCVFLGVLLQWLYFCVGVCYRQRWLDIHYT